MKVLMFGWEFPPHISGGLGTACFGLTKGLTELDGLDITFVVPKVYGDENPVAMHLLGANNIPVSRKEMILPGNDKKLDYIEVKSGVIPYVSEEEFWELKKKKFDRQIRLVKTDSGFKIPFTGQYGPGLMEEIRNYALVAEVIAAENSFDIIHAHDWLAYPAGMAAKRISEKPLVIHVHATDFDRSGGNVNPRVYAVEREGMEQADHIIAVSTFTRNTIVEKYGIPAGKVTVVYNAVEPLDLHAESAFPKKKKGEKVVTFLGRITLQKGPEYFVEAASLVLRKMNNVRFVMAGSGDMLNSMIHRVAELGIADRFHFTGFLNGKDVAQMFSQTDVFVMPSVSEPFGIVPLEAMQLKVPVIISNQSGVSEVIENAIKIDFWDTLAMADAIYALLNYESLSEHLKETGKKEVDKLKWVHSAQKVKEVYQKVLNQSMQ